MVFIYYFELRDKLYIGSTISPYQRQRNHQLNGTTKIDCCDSSKDKESIKLNIIDAVNLKERFYWELFYINLFRTWGFNLKNKQKIHNINKREHEYSRNKTTRTTNTETNFNSSIQKRHKEIKDKSEKIRIENDSIYYRSIARGGK